MPIGLPAQGSDPTVHYTNLNTRLIANVAAGNAVRARVADEPTYSGLFAMCNGFLRYIPAGGSAPDGTTLTAPMLVLKTWLWAFLELRKSAPPGSVLSKLIGYGNVDANEVRLAIRAELSTNSRYVSLTTAQRTQAENDFL